MKNLIKIFMISLFFLILPINIVNAEEKNNEGTQNLYKETMQTVSVFTVNSKPITVTDEDIDLMAQVVYAESCGEPYKGKVAVASVILNRVLADNFPKSIKGVITQKNAFSCVINGKVMHRGNYNFTPNSLCYSAVLEALKGKDPTGSALFFYNPKIATCTWMKNIKKDNMRAIGNHVFFVIN